MSLKNPVTPPGIDPGTVRLVGQRLNHYATPGPKTELIDAVNVENDIGSEQKKRSSRIAKSNSKTNVMLTCLRPTLC